MNSAIKSLLLLIASFADDSFADCPDKEEINQCLAGAEGKKFAAISCKIDSSSYLVTLHLFESGSEIDRIAFGAEGAYALSVDTNLDFDQDGIPDIGIANGKGKGGNGMSYWLVRNRAPYLVSLGDFPKIERGRSQESPLFSFIPGSGDVTTTRFEYAYSNETLSAVKATQFKAVPGGGYTGEILIYDLGSNSWMPSGKSTQLSESKFTTCMSDGKC